MCGIAGFCLNPNDHVNANTLSKKLLLGIEHRGRDATGAAWRNENGDVMVAKHDSKASDFVPHLNVWRKAQTVILHTRAWTQGSPDKADNNHPIHAGRIVGVHNGMCSNDSELFRKAPNYKRKGEVDSEAIFATINRVDDSFSIVNALEAPEASMALAWFDLSDNEDDELNLARGDSSPLWIGQTDNGSLVFASTKDAVLEAGKEVGLEFPYLESVAEGQYFRVRAGMIAEVTKFNAMGNWVSQYGYGGTGYTIIRDSKTSTKSEGSAAARRTGISDSKSFLSMAYLDADADIPSMSNEVFRTTYKRRNEAIGEWVSDHCWVAADEELRDSHAVFDYAAGYGAFLRPGSWVRTEYGGYRCDAQVYRLPDTFPEGQYILRVLSPYWDEATEEVEYEAVYLARTIDGILDGPALYLDHDSEPTLELTL